MAQCTMHRYLDVMMGIVGGKEMQSNLIHVIVHFLNAI
jgi:hypothetical protein